MYETTNEKLEQREESLSYDKKRKLEDAEKEMEEIIKKTYQDTLASQMKSVQRKQNRALSEYKRKLIEGDEYRPKPSYFISVNCSALDKRPIYDAFIAYKKLAGKKTSDIILGMIKQWVDEQEKIEAEKIKAELESAAALPQQSNGNPA